MANEPVSDRNGDHPTAANSTDFFASRPPLDRGFEAYNIPPVSRTTAQPPQTPVQPASPEAPPRAQQKRRWRWLALWRRPSQPAATAPEAGTQAAPPTQANPSQANQQANQQTTHHSAAHPSANRPSTWPFSTAPQPAEPPTNWHPLQEQQAQGRHQGTAHTGISRQDTAPLTDPAFDHTGSPESYTPTAPAPPQLWEKQPYRAILHLLAVGGTLTGGWFFGILAADLFPGSIEQPPLQESVLRKASRLSDRLWNFTQLWRSPTVETRIEPIPIPETGPVLSSVTLSPIERQPITDELNTIETELLTLDRRLQTLEKKLGKPPYQGADIDSRLSALRAAIDPSPVAEAAPPAYTPVPQAPGDTLLEVASLRIVMPSDALFTPGQSELKDTPLLTQVLDQLVNYPKATVLIVSHSDDQASPSASRDYTLAQANALQVYLNASLPSSHRWITIGSGSAQPLTENKDAAQRQRNRRVEILVDTRPR